MSFTTSMYHGGCPLEQAKTTGCLASAQLSNFILFPNLVYSNWKCSKPRFYQARNGGCRIIFMDKGCRQQLRVRSSESGFEALDVEVQDDGELDGPQKRFRERGDEKDYDRDPEFAEILGSCLDDPDKAQSKVRCFS